MSDNMENKMHIDFLIHNIECIKVPDHVIIDDKKISPYIEYSKCRNCCVDYIEYNYTLDYKDRYYDCEIYVENNYVRWSVGSVCEEASKEMIIPDDDNEDNVYNAIMSAAEQMNYEIENIKKDIDREDMNE